MESLTALEASRFPNREREVGARLDAFRSTDAFALAALKAAADLARSDWPDLAAEIRRLVLRGGGALVAASCLPSGDRAERALLEAARDRLAEARYALYLARRLGAFDARRYRALGSQQDAALREIAALLPGNGGGRPPP